MHHLESRSIALTPTSILAMKPTKVKAANFVKSKFESALNCLNQPHEEVLLEFFSYLSHMQTTPHIEKEFRFASLGLFKNDQDWNAFKQAIEFLCHHEHSGLNQNHMSDYVYLSEENKRLNFPLSSEINFTASNLRLMDSFVRHIYEGKKILFQSNLVNQKSVFTKNHSLILNFFQNHFHAESEHFILEKKKADPQLSSLQLLKIHMKYMKSHKDKICEFIIYAQNIIDQNFCYFDYHNKKKILNRIKTDPQYQNYFLSYFGKDLDHILEPVYTICLSDRSRHECAPLLYDFGSAKFSQGCTLLIESLGHQFLQLESDFEMRIKEYLNGLLEHVNVVQKDLIHYVKLTRDFCFSFVGVSVFLATMSAFGYIYSNPLSDCGRNLLPLSIIGMAMSSGYFAVKTVSVVHNLIDQMADLFLELIELCDPDDIFSYIYKRNLAQIQPYLSAQGIDVSMHTGKTHINYFGVKIFKHIANNVATFGMNSFRPTTNWWLNTINFRKPAYPNLETETLHSYKDQIKYMIQIALNHELSYPKVRSYARFVDKVVLEPYVDPILNGRFFPKLS